MAEHAEPENAQRLADSLEAAVPPVAEIPATPEISAPMLDVHAPHEAIHTCIFDSDPTHLTPAQLAEEMTYTKEVLVQHFAAAAALVQLNRADPSFTPALTKDELNEIMHVSDAEQDPKLAAAVAITNRRLPADAQIPLSQSKTKPESSPLPAQQDVEAVSKVAAPSNRNK